MVMRSVKDLKVYDLSLQICIDVYHATECFPPEDRFGLTSQMRRAVVSIGSNLAEGASRITKQDYKHFVAIARGSAAELLFQLEVAKKLKFITEKSAKSLQEKIEEIMKMLSGLLKSLTLTTSH